MPFVRLYMQHLVVSKIADIQRHTLVVYIIVTQFQPLLRFFLFLYIHVRTHVNFFLSVTIFYFQYFRILTSGLVVAFRESYLSLAGSTTMERGNFSQVSFYE